MSDNLNTIGIRGKIAARTPDYRYTLPEGGNPGDIPVKTENGVEWQQPEPATTTPDWSQNDEAASDYIKNRPGGYTVNYPALNIEWDGVIGDRVVVELGFGKVVKVSDEIPKVEQLVGGTMSVKKGDTSNTVSITYETIDNLGNGIYTFGSGAISVNKAPANLVHPSTGAVLAVFPETGVYFAYNSLGATIMYISSLALPAKSVIVPIPQEYVEGLEEVASDATAAKTAAESIDMRGKTWTQSNATDGNFNAIVYANGLWVAGSSVGNNGLYYSTDGKTWTQSNVTNSYFNAIVYANGLWVAGSNGNNGLYYSTSKYALTDTVNAQLAEVKQFIDEIKSADVILPSSTAGSTKKFKITVDDAGAISATEVTT